MMEAVRTSETSVDNHFTRQYNPEDSSEQVLTFFQSSFHLKHTSYLHRGKRSNVYKHLAKTKYKGRRSKAPYIPELGTRA